MALSSKILVLHLVVISTIIDVVCVGGAVVQQRHNHFGDILMAPASVGEVGKIFTNHSCLDVVYGVYIIQLYYWYGERSSSKERLHWKDE